MNEKCLKNSGKTYIKWNDTSMKLYDTSLKLECTFYRLKKLDEIELSYLLKLMNKVWKTLGKPILESLESI